jgi:hypothetical protein
MTFFAITQSDDGHYRELGFLCDLDGLVDVGSTTRIEALGRRQPPTPIAEMSRASLEAPGEASRRSRTIKDVRKASGCAEIVRR